jgi:hypothetical protein
VFLVIRGISYYNDTVLSQIICWLKYKYIASLVAKQPSILRNIQTSVVCFNIQFYSTNRKMTFRKDRVHHEKDTVFQAFNKTLYTSDWDFDRAWKLCNFESWKWQNPVKEWIDDAKNKYNMLVEEWNYRRELKNKSDTLYTYGYCALTHVFIVVPFEHLGSNLGTYLNEFQVTQINRIKFYNNEPMIPVTNVEDLLVGPAHPAAYEQYLNDLYDRASWWCSYFVYEWQQGLPCIALAPPAVLSPSSSSKQ